jgi:hypothetical protein
MSPIESLRRELDHIHAPSYCLKDEEGKEQFVVLRIAEYNKLIDTFEDLADVVEALEAERDSTGYTSLEALKREFGRV